jgi:hypothetical protein
VRDQKDWPIFGLLDEHRKLVESAPTSNWFWPFRDSVDLKERVASDLKYASSRALMTRCLGEGRLPSLRALVQAQTAGPPGKVTFSLHFFVRGRQPALDAVLRTEGNPENRLGDITADHRQTAGIDCLVPANGRLQRELFVEYATEFGVVVEDTFNLRAEFGPGAGLPVIELKRRRLVRGTNVDLG